MTKFYRVGGYVRDKLMDRPSNDIDYSVEANSYDEMIEAIRVRGMKIIYEMDQYLTVRARYNGTISDFVMCRKDGNYRDGRRPENVTPGTLLDDLSRRDFTINAIAEDENCNYIDPFGGIDDLMRKIIRCVGSIDRLKEDSLRLLRALRFYIILDGFTLDQEIEDALRDETIINLLDNISNDRIREELEKCFKYDSLKTINVLHKYPLLMNKLFKNKNLWLKPTFEKIRKNKPLSD